jgi:hypothetical protein
MRPDEAQLIDMDKVESIHVSRETKSIKINFESGRGCEIARYNTYEQCRYVLGMIMQALKAEERTFLVPQEVDLDVARRHSSQFKTSKNRHGGS